jgi:hypothetical protein
MVENKRIQIALLKPALEKPEENVVDAVFKKY